MKDLPSEFDAQSIRQLKVSLDKEGSQLVTSCHQLKMLATDGKQRETDLKKETRNKLIDFRSGINVKAQLEFDPCPRLVVKFLATPPAALSQGSRAA